MNKTDSTKGIGEHGKGDATLPLTWNEKARTNLSSDHFQKKSWEMTPLG